MLWGRAASCCSIPECRRDLVIDETETDDPSVVGDAAHIVAESNDGPRGDSPLTPEQRDRYSNLILLCKTHHKMVDDQPGKYTVVKLTTIKREHEAWVRTTLKKDPILQRDEETYASIIDELARRADLDGWRAWASYVLSPSHIELRREHYAQLPELRDFLFSRVLPGRFEDLELALENFRCVLQDFLTQFGEYARDPNGSGEFLHFEKFYQIREWNPKLYEMLRRRYIFATDLIQDLMLELTRAANHVCDVVRARLNPAFRMKEGRLIVDTGPYDNMKVLQHRLNYGKSDLAAKLPYPGLERFKSERSNRDWVMGAGVSEEDPAFVKTL